MGLKFRNLGFTCIDYQSSILLSRVELLGLGVSEHTYPITDECLPSAGVVMGRDLSWVKP